MKEDFYAYETKCRRCNNMTVWYYQDCDKADFHPFIKGMVDYLQIPPSCFCKKCKKNTVQDVVWYGRTNHNETK